MTERTRNEEQTIVEALQAAATSEGFEALEGTIKDALKKADKRLNAIIQYWKTRKLPDDPPEAEPVLGAIPFYCTHPDKIPKAVPKYEYVKALLKGLAKIRVVPKTNRQRYCVISTSSGLSSGLSRGR